MSSFIKKWDLDVFIRVTLIVQVRAVYMHLFGSRLVIVSNAMNATAPRTVGCCTSTTRLWEANVGITNHVLDASLQAGFLTPDVPSKTTLQSF
jgi:hypothetical protein